MLDFLDEFSNEASRFIIVKDLDIVDRYNVIAFVHFRFTVQGEVFDDMIGDPCVFIYDIHVQSEYQSKGLSILNFAIFSVIYTLVLIFIELKFLSFFR